MGYLTLKDLENCFEDAKKRTMPYIGVKIQMKNCEKPEIIINLNKNFDTKLDYYKKAYNDDLTLKSCPSIKIVGFEWGISFYDIQCKLL